MKEKLECEVSCFYCNTVNDLRTCPDCGIKSCQKHFPLHVRGGSCAKWIVKEVPGAGRGLFAFKRIKAGEIVVEDWAVVEGPLPTSQQVCLVCLADEGCSECSVCKFPVCKSRTKGCLTRHKGECKVLTAAVKENLSTECIYTCIAAIRLMWTMEREPGIRELLDRLMDHRDIHRGEENEGWNAVVHFLLKQGFSLENIERSLGLLQTNGVTSTSVAGTPRGHALYPIFSIVNNSCISNTRHGRVEDSFCLIATVDIEAGVEICTNYKSPTLGNSARQPAFQSLWNFQCSCPRCDDPTELGTYASALLCPDCSANILPSSNNIQDDWECEKCNKKMKFQQIQDKTNKAQTLIQNAGHNIEKLENLVTILCRMFSKHHYILMQIKRMLVLMYGNCNSHRLQTMSKKDIDRKIELCREYIEIFNILEPGLTKWKGRVCEELARALVRRDGAPGVEVCRLIGEAGKCRQLDSQQERSAFNVRVTQIMNP